MFPDPQWIHFDKESFLTVNTSGGYQSKVLQGPEITIPFGAGRVILVSLAAAKRAHWLAAEDYESLADRPLGGRLQFNHLKTGQRRNLGNISGAASYTPPRDGQ